MSGESLEEVCDAWVKIMEGDVDANLQFRNFKKSRDNSNLHEVNQTIRVIESPENSSVVHVTVKWYSRQNQVKELRMPMKTHSMWLKLITESEAEVAPMENSEFPQESGAILKESWRFKLGKCVDASPLVMVLESRPNCINEDVSSECHKSFGVVFIGSHSHAFSAVLFPLENSPLPPPATRRSHLPLWTTQLPDRIEASATLTLSGYVYNLKCTSNFRDSSVKTEKCL